MKKNVLTVLFTAILGTAALTAEAGRAVVYTETVPGETGPTVVEVVVKDGVFSSLKVLGPDEAKTLEDEAVTESMNARVRPAPAETLAVDPLSGSLDPSDRLIEAIREGIAAAKVNDEGRELVFQTGTWHRSLDAADRDIKKETRAELAGDAKVEHAGFRVDPLSGSIEAPEELTALVARALKRAGKVKESPRATR